MKLIILLAYLIGTSAFADNIDVAKVSVVKPCQFGELDPSPASPPNNTDDPGTTDTGCYEINHTFAIDRAKNPDGTTSDYTDYIWDANFGVNEDLQAKLVVHYNSQTIRDINAAYDASASAFGRIEIGAKKRIFKDENKGLDISLFPTIDFMTPGTPAVARGLPDSGTNLTLPILISKKYGPVVFINNAGIVVPLNDPNKPAQIILSTSAGINISPSTILTGEIYRTSATNLKEDVTTSVGVGVSSKISENALVYMSLGETIGSTADGASHAYALAGIKVLFGKGSQKAKELRFNFNNEEDL